ncbi:MAG: metallophosphoesterase [Nitrospirae bacterium]|nr:metallophosphoesterase [Nitrospirota bacterium]
MYLFLTTFFLLYGGMHLYAFLKTRSALAFSTNTGIYLILFMTVMVFSPFIIRFSERLELNFFARFMSYIGYTWMGVLFLFFSASVCMDIYRLVIYLAGFISHNNFSSLIPSARLSFYFPLMLSLIIGIYGYFEALDIRTEKVEIKTSKIPEEIGRLRIVQISDVHLGLIVRGERFERILKEVKEANPDILISTGDLVDGQIDGLSEFAGLLKEINPKYGKFAITGNHEFYAGLGQTLDFTEKAGFKIFRGEGTTVAGLINVAGVDDPQGKTYGLYKGVSERELLSKLPIGKFTLLLKHRPEVDKESIGLFDLQLSGHAHKGQIFPFSLLTWLYYRHTIHAGELRLVDDSYLYVSRGAGTWGPPIRFLSPPEVTIIELIHEGD